LLLTYYYEEQHKHDINGNEDLHQYFNSTTKDWNDYVKRFTEANGVMEDAQNLHLFLTLIRVSKVKLLSNLIALQEPGDPSYTQVVKKLQLHFKPKMLII